MAQYQHIHTQTHELAFSILGKLEKAPYQSTTAKRDIISPDRSLIGETNKNFYQPRIIAVGPYHRNCEGVKHMEEKKLGNLLEMLNANGDIQSTLHIYLEELRELEPKARSCYEGNIGMNPDDFVEMLLLDAFIIIRLVLDWSRPGIANVFNISHNSIPVIKSDLLLLENQIPFFVLQRLFDHYSRSKDNTPAIGNSTSEATNSYGHSSVFVREQSLVFWLANFLLHESETLSVPEGDNKYDNLLHFYYRCYIRSEAFPTKPMMKSSLLSSHIERLTWNTRLQMIVTKGAGAAPKIIPSATELQEDGITFKKAKEKGIFRVHFSHGVLSIPSISVAEDTMPRIMNLIAYEKFNGQQYKPFTSYVVFMYCIVKFPKDVKMLGQNRILENTLGNEEAFVDSFKQMMWSPCLDNEDHHLGELFSNMKHYGDSSPWQKFKTKVLGDYLRNPWLVIPAATSGVLLLLSGIQTLYTVMSYYDHP